MINEEELQPATVEDMKGIDTVEFKRMIEESDKQEVRLRGLYLKHPNRKQFFEYDFVEALWFHTLDYYGKAVGNDEIETMVYSLAENERLWQLVYDTVQEFANEKGWKMK